MEFSCRILTVKFHFLFIVIVKSTTPVSWLCRNNESESIFSSTAVPATLPVV